MICSPPEKWAAFLTCLSDWHLISFPFLSLQQEHSLVTLPSIKVLLGEWRKLSLNSLASTWFVIFYMPGKRLLTICLTCSQQVFTSNFRTDLGCVWLQWQNEMGWDDPLIKVVWFRVNGWDKTIPVLSLIIHQNCRDKRGHQRTSLSWLFRSQTQTRDHNGIHGKEIPLWLVWELHFPKGFLFF